ncbi:uncharacterized protein GGS22DRAFT_186691 [Annulohypoxylon maeteangense]|uniref:uncharacterized protein n=1 Tax=Annulohypoxylon maeteangense TaxID=1927788 RepID=UPI0020077D2A|nr:uncharacterized protein GGS22DRAFT_186691 [Annulohypoxylon maeteangense]KAI0886623.1 hypothetical protein GGS22DRAFT_186691 [Annulohypoxylon maeteangense]
MFHKFLKLPIELQLVIWHFHWPPTRHYFTLYDARIREYGAISMEDERYVNRLVPKRKKATLDFIPFLTKIPFTGQIRVRLRRVVSVDPPEPEFSMIGSKAEVYVYFAQDVFYFDDFPYYYPLTDTWAKEEWFRFLRKPITQLQPPKLHKSHWIFKVRNLALRLEWIGESRGTEWDHTILRKMKSLKEVWLVHPRTPNIAIETPFLMINRTFNELPYSVDGGVKDAYLYLQGKMKEYGIDAPVVMTTIDT